jgi:hypothetical protein
MDQIADTAIRVCRWRVEEDTRDEERRDGRRAADDG